MYSVPHVLYRNAPVQPLKDPVGDWWNPVDQQQDIYPTLQFDEITQRLHPGEQMSWLVMDQSSHRQAHTPPGLK